MLAGSDEALTTSQPLIMVIDDDDLTRESIAALLTSRGFRVMEHASGATALRALIEGGRPDLIVLDLVMPDLNGWEFRQRQLADSMLASIPVIAMSGDRSPMAEAIHAARFLHKPLEAIELLQAIDAELAARRRTLRTSEGRRSQRRPSVDASAFARSTKVSRAHSIAAEAEQLRLFQLQLVARSLSHVVSNALQGMMSYAQCRLNESEEERLRGAVFDSAHSCAAVLRKFADSTLLELHNPHAMQLGTEQALMMEATWRSICPASVELHVTDLPLMAHARVPLSLMLAMTTELIRNAVEALAKNRGTVRVRNSHQERRLEDLAATYAQSNRRPGLWCCLEVVNGGDPIPESELPLIWFPFYSTRFPGRGLGLAWVLARMTELGGLVEAESSREQGTAVRLLFPLAGQSGAQA